jgi:hypothetical protein
MLMFVIKLLLARLLTWFFETCLELIVLGLILIGLFGYDKHAFVKDLELYVSVWLLGLFVSGYFVTTFFFRALWKGQSWWSYSVVAVALFLVHTEIAFVLYGVSTASDKIRMQMPGVFVVFSCTVVGTLALRKFVPKRKISAPIRDPV